MDSCDLCWFSSPFLHEFLSTHRHRNLTLYNIHGRLARCKQLRHLASKDSSPKNIPLCHRQTVCPWAYPFPETALSSLIEQMGLPTATSARLAWHPLMARNSHFQTHPATPCWHEKGSSGGRIGRYLPYLPYLIARISGSVSATAVAIPDW